MKYLHVMPRLTLVQRLASSTHFNVLEFISPRIPIALLRKSGDDVREDKSEDDVREGKSGDDVAEDNTKLYNSE